MEPQQENIFSKELAQFEHNLAEVSKLVHFDTEVLEFVKEYIEAPKEEPVSTNWASRQKGHNLKQAVSSTLQNSIRLGRLKPGYQSIYNQCVVLYVSHLETLLKGIFKGAVSKLLKSEKPPFSINKLKLSASDLLEWGGSIQGLITEKLAIEQSFRTQGICTVAPYSV